MKHDSRLQIRWCTALRLCTAPGLWLNCSLALAAVEVTASFDPQTSDWTLRYCQPGESGRSLELRAADPAASRWLDKAIPAAQTRGRRGLFWPAEALVDSCVSLHFPLQQIAGTRERDTGWQAGSDLLSWSSTWWFQPLGQKLTELRLDLPKGYHFSAPWPRCADQQEHCYLLGAAPLGWPTVTVLSRSAPQQFMIGQAMLESSIVGGVDAATRAKLERLPHTAGQLISQAYGRLPVPGLQVLIIPVDQGRERPMQRSDQPEPVVFGQLYRGGLGGVHLFVNSAASSAAFDQDWVLPHELSHLLHPYLGDRRGRWLSEGLASYYQNLLRSRSGKLDPDIAWQKLFEGFDRGRAATSADSLDDIAAGMGRNHAFMRIYWSGAAFWLKVDVALRQSGHPGLDRLLDRFGREHLPATYEWDPDGFLRALDQQLPEPLLLPLAERLGRESSFPEVSAELAALGLRWSAGKLDHAAAVNALREAIARARAP